MTDRVTELPSGYALGVGSVVRSAGHRDVERCLMDALVVARGGAPPCGARCAAVRLHPALRRRRAAVGHAAPCDARGRGALHGVLLRCYDSNDLCFGGRAWAHSGDVVGGLLSVADWRPSSGAALLDAISVAYDVVCSSPATPHRSRPWLGTT